MPMLILSGVFFSNARFPEVTQPFIQALPLTALNDALRAVYNDGESLGAVIPEMLLMVGWTGLVFFLALRLFRWQ
jgi:ABC-2 type transport system permease protein